MSQFDKQKLIEILNRCSGFNVHNGIIVKDLDEESCIVEAELNENTMNPLGMAHGGFVYSLCDVATGVAAGEMRRNCVTLSGNMYYMRPSKGRKLRVEARTVKKGKSIALTEAIVYDEENTVTARGMFEYFYVE